MNFVAANWLCLAVFVACLFVAYRLRSVFFLFRLRRDSESVDEKLTTLQTKQAQVIAPRPRCKIRKTGPAGNRDGWVFFICKHCRNG